MSAPTTGLRFLIARAGVRTTGVAHLVSQRDTGALNPVCGANPIRSAKVDYPDAVTCADCRGIQADLAGNGVTDVPLDGLTLPDGARDTDDALAQSVRVNGVLVPIIVRPTDTGHHVVAGARRVAAIRAAGGTTIPAIIRTLDPDTEILTRLLENLHRENLDPIAQAHAYKSAQVSLGISKAELGRRLGLSRPQISNTIRLLDLPADEQARIAAGELTAQDGRALLAESKASAPKPAKRTANASQLAEFTDAQIRVTTTRAGRARVLIDLPKDDLDRLLDQLGLQQENVA